MSKKITPLFDIGDLIVDNTNLSLGIIIDIISSDFNNEITYKLISQYGVLFWDQRSLIDRIINETAEIHRKIAN